MSIHIFLGAKCGAAGTVFSVAVNTGCRKYYMSAPGMEPLLYTCPDNYVFDVTVCTCDDPSGQCL